jgi:hypothetical protein
LFLLTTIDQINVFCRQSIIGIDPINVFFTIGAHYDREQALAWTIV